MEEIQHIIDQMTPSELEKAMEYLNSLLASAEESQSSHPENCE